MGTERFEDGAQVGGADPVIAGGAPVVVRAAGMDPACGLPDGRRSEADPGGGQVVVELLPCGAGTQDAASYMTVSAM